MSDKIKHFISFLFGVSEQENPLYTQILEKVTDDNNGRLQYSSKSDSLETVDTDYSSGKVAHSKYWATKATK